MQQRQPGIGKDQRSRSPFSELGEPLEKKGRLLVPVKQFADVEAALAYVRMLDHRADIRLAFLHVTSPTEAMASATHPGYAEELLEQAESRCRADAVAHESYILAGDLVFSILDTAELLACDAIVMPCLKPRRWHHFLPTKIVRKVERLSLEVPLVLIDADGVVIRSKSL